MLITLRIMHTTKPVDGASQYQKEIQSNYESLNWISKQRYVAQATLLRSEMVDTRIPS